MKRHTLLSFLLLCAGLVHAATETPAYTVVRAEGDFEVRDYPALTVATAPMEDPDGNRSFRQLFRFITGANETREKIAMTAPVLIDSAKPARHMSFIMPAKAVAQGIPKPEGDGVTLSRVEPARYAVWRYSGARSAKNEAAAQELLGAWVAKQDLAAHGEPLFAHYDPPWIPFFMRRNEVMFRLVTSPRAPAGPR